MPRCRPSGSRVARAVVAGIRARGASSRRTEISSSVVRTLPAGSRPKGCVVLRHEGPDADHVGPEAGDERHVRGQTGGRLARGADHHAGAGLVADAAQGVEAGEERRASDMSSGCSRR